MKKIRTAAIIMLMIATSTMCACFPKGYTAKEEKDQLAHAIAITRVYQEKYADSARFMDEELHVYDSMPEDERKLYLTDWVYGRYYDGGDHNIYINTGSNRLYSDKEWNKVQAYGQKLAGQLYGIKENRMTVDVWGFNELPFCKDDDSFGMLTLTNMLPATDQISGGYVRELLQSDEYRFTYRIDVNESVDIDMFRKLDFSPLGKNVRLSVRRYSNDAFADRKAHPEKRSVSNKEGLLDEYYSDEEKSETEEETSKESTENTNDPALSAQDQSDDTKMLEMLYGDWEIMDDAELIQEPGIKRDRLRFALPRYHRVRFITADGDQESFDMELRDVFEEPGNTYDRLILSNRPGAGMYDWDEVRPEQSFRIMIANNLGYDYMMLRELADVRTGFATNGLKYDRSMQGLWMLRRADPNDYGNEFDEVTSTPSTAGIEDEIRQKDTSFYAIKWMEFGNSCTLQRVETVKANVNGEDVLEYFVPEDEYAYSAVNYEYKGQENMAHGGYFDPALVRVVTDENGQITDIAKFEYAWDGVYYDREI